MPLDLSKPVQTRDGRKVRILCTDAGGERPIVGLIDGIVWRWAVGGFDAFGPGRDLPGDLVNVPEPERTVWLNLYDRMQMREPCYDAYDTRKEADEAAELCARNWTRIACIEVKYRPGQGIET